MRTLLSKAKYYLDKPYIRVGYDPMTGILFNIWNGFAAYEEIQQIGQRTIEAALFEKPKKALFDTRNMEVLDEPSQSYISHEFARRIREVGIKYTATVIPEDEFAQTSVYRIKDAILPAAVTELRYFKQLSSAVKWLNGK